MDKKVIISEAFLANIIKDKVHPTTTQDIISRTKKRESLLNLLNTITIPFYTFLFFGLNPVALAGIPVAVVASYLGVHGLSEYDINRFLHKHGLLEENESVVLDY